MSFLYRDTMTFWGERRPLMYLVNLSLCQLHGEPLRKLADVANTRTHTNTEHTHTHNHTAHARTHAHTHTHTHTRTLQEQCTGLKSMEPTGVKNRKQTRYRDGHLKKEKEKKFRMLQCCTSIATRDKRRQPMYDKYFCMLVFQSRQILILLMLWEAVTRQRLQILPLPILPPTILPPPPPPDTTTTTTTITTTASQSCINGYIYQKKGKLDNHRTTQGCNHLQYKIKLILSRRKILTARQDGGVCEWVCEWVRVCVCTCVSAHVYGVCVCVSESVCVYVCVWKFLINVPRNWSTGVATSIRKLQLQTFVAAKCIGLSCKSLFAAAKVPFAATTSLLQQQPREPVLQQQNQLCTDETSSYSCGYQICPKFCSYKSGL